MGKWLDALRDLDDLEDRALPFTPNPGPRLPATDRWRFVTDSPFTRRLLELATERWQEPLSDEDWADIAGGRYLFEHRMAALASYLRGWVADNPERWAELLAVWQAAAPPPQPPALTIDATGVAVSASREWFATQGCHLLGEDLAFIRERLPIGATRRNEAIRQYAAVWIEAMAAEPVEHCKQNAGRHAANSWLRTGKEKRQ